MHTNMIDKMMAEVPDEFTAQGQLLAPAGPRGKLSLGSIGDGSGTGRGRDRGLDDDQATRPGRLLQGFDGHWRNPSLPCPVRPGPIRSGVVRSAHIYRRVLPI